MTRLESSAWPLAAGSATVFALSVLLRSLTWTVGFVVLAMAVAAWSLRTPVITGVALGLIAWLFLTSFDVNADGALRFSGWADVARIWVLIGAALAGTAAGRMSAWSYGGRYGTQPDEPEEPIWVAPHRLVGQGVIGVQMSSGVSDGDHHSRIAAMPNVRPRTRNVNGTVH
jgi:hypothetical protein